MNWDDLKRKCNANKANAQSKLAVTMFGIELHRRSVANGWGITSNVPHPGVTATDLLAAHPEMGRSPDTSR